MTDLLTPSQVAQELNISVTTLRKYSLIVEKVTENASFFARTSNRRNYSQTNVADIKQMLLLNKRDNLNLEVAAKQVFNPEAIVEETTNVTTDEKLQQEIVSLKNELKKLQQENSELRNKLAKSTEKVSDSDEKAEKDRKYEEMLVAARKARAEKLKAAEHDTLIENDIQTPEKIRTLVSMQVEESHKKRKWWNKFI